MGRKPSADGIKVVSFDAEGTLVTPDFSLGMWYECIPEAYSRKQGISVAEARDAVVKEYQRVGDGRLEWYDVRHWYSFFGLGDYRDAFRRCQPRIRLYPDVKPALARLGQRYRMVVVSASIREFLEELVSGVSRRFDRIISSVSDYHELKTPELYLKVCRELDIHPGEMAHVGDNRQYDYLNAREAGLRAFHLDRQGRDNGGDTVTGLDQLAGLLLDR